MSRAKRILRFTFWVNNLVFLLLAALIIVSFSHLFYIWAPILSVMLVVTCVAMLWYMQHHLGVKSFKGLYWVDDERDRLITLKVHSTVMISATYFLCGLLGIICLLLNWHLSTQELGQTLLAIIWLALVASNLQYYWLWLKYDQA
ncbi:DUF2178 domain-containing protein [Levilactobacillus brevis]|uniref:Uncharacterized protein n=1 Tax=Levilactobacillus brevis ATCC 14869 = DSM 20054 TaxID=649758 RepID=U2PL04_LEVBR|nr:DUF2178 domain-containing protein [Levilactobacillus brevis]ERK44831.1 hypothetical protein HMPREF0495_00629 [Levilactobacillus brevis ATCC 14869 = DSM 20054]KIO98890.1 hypothetical protein QP38_1579 [Levilactobacillus brevis]MCT3571177.1 hypothetical protein [Levilactobacillus brevis]MCT3572087.1 hypothetical protein [Levilactobacillus brevis]SQG82117.1 Uncharacterised protein [Levilactobacillus brevis]